MKGYKIATLSKLLLAVCLVGIILAVVNHFTGFINGNIQIGGTIVCIIGFVIASVAIIFIEDERKKKSRE